VEGDGSRSKNGTFANPHPGADKGFRGHPGTGIKRDWASDQLERFVIYIV
jgi:hypothetical protein